MELIQIKNKLQELHALRRGEILTDNGLELIKELDYVLEQLSLHLVSNGTSAKDIKMYRKQGRMSGAIKREPFYKLIAQKFDEDYCDYDFTLLYDC